MKNYLCKSLLGLSLILTVSCATDTESLDETGLESTETSLLKEPVSYSRVTPSKGNTYYIKNVNSGKFLDVKGISKKKGANVHQWDFTGNKNQKWKLVDFNGNARFVAQHSGMSLDVAGYSKSDGGKIHQWSKTSNNNQKWIIYTSENNDNRFYIQSKHSGYRLGTKKNQKGNGISIVQNKADKKGTQGAQQQLWAFYKTN